MSITKKMGQLTLLIEKLDRELVKTLIHKNQIHLMNEATEQQFNRYLTVAVESRDSSVVRSLLEVRPRLDATVGAKLLWKVIDDTDTRVAEMLVRAGADVNRSFNRNSTSLLHVLAKSNNPRKYELALLLIKHGANVNARNKACYSVLHYASIHGNHALAQELLKQGVVVDKNALGAAIRSPTRVTSTLLLVNGDHVHDATARSELVANTFGLLFQSEIKDEDIVETMEALLDVEIPQAKVIFKAVQYNRFRVVKLLLQRPDIDKSIKMMFLHEALCLPQSAMTRMLLEWGADIEYKEQFSFGRGLHPLHIACLYWSQRNIRSLLHLGANINAVDNSGKTPFAFLTLKIDHTLANNELHPQFMENCQLIIKHFALLTSKGATVNEQDLTLIESFPTLERFYDECLTELEAMKEVRIISGFRFYSILNKSIQELSLLMRRQAFVKGFNDNLDFFNVYHSDLKQQFWEAGRRMNLLKPKEESLTEALHGTLPGVPIEKIVRYLYLNDVETVGDRLRMLD